MPWYQLLNVRKQNQEVRERERVTPPVACPIDGEPLVTKTDGSRWCPVGNYVWRG